MDVKVTVGVCVRNCQDTITKTIGSILAQDFPHSLMEIIFVDDGSNDRTLNIIENYIHRIDMRVKVFHHKWKGLGYSRNVVLKNSNGQYVLWVDGDIVIPSNYVKTMVEFMENNIDVAIAGGSYGILNKASLVAFLDNVEYVAYRFRSGTNLPGTGGAIYRVKVIKEIGGFDENIKGSCEDIDVAHKIAAAGWSIVRDKAPFYAYGKENWKECWNHYLWHGYGAHYIKHKHKQIFSLARMCLPTMLIGGILHSVIAFKIIKQKRVFLLPFYVLFKNTAWWIGFMKAHMNGYGHGISKQKMGL